MTSLLSSGQIPAGRKVDLATMLQAGYNGLKTDLTEAAALMPDADYHSKPSKMADMRTYGEVIMHVADGQFSVCAAAKGVPNPNQGKAPQQQPKAKMDIVRALADSFAFCDDVFSSLTEASLAEFVKQGPGEISRGAILLGFIAHGAEMYGITTVYLRAKNIVPPSTARQKRR